MKNLFLVLVIGLLGHIRVAVAQPITLEIVSDTLPSQPTITVYLPASYADETKAYPVIYVLDGEHNGGLVASMLHRLQVSGAVMEHIVVGVESDNRLRDFAPTVNRDPRGPVGQGGGDAFLDFMQDALIPLVDKTYRTRKHSVLAGHSVGGLLVMHSFHSRPALFQGHLAFSPAVWWGEQKTAEATKAYVLSGKVKANYLYMNIGSEGGDLRYVYDMLAYAIQRNQPLDLALQQDAFKYAEHEVTLVAGLYNALKGLHAFQRKQGM